MKKLKTTAKWALLNFAVLGAFLGGFYFALPSLTTVAVVIYWLTSLVALGVYAVMQSELMRTALLIDNSSIREALDNKVVPLWVDQLYDLLVVTVLVYFSYPVLAIAYAIHTYLLWRSIQILKG